MNAADIREERWSETTAEAPMTAIPGTMTIYIDADACPVTRIAEDIARKYGIPVTLLDYIILHVPEAAIMGKSGIKAIRIIIPDEDI